jgi:hypothetical protein
MYCFISQLGDCFIACLSLLLKEWVVGLNAAFLQPYGAQLAYGNHVHDVN